MAKTNTLNSDSWANRPNPLTLFGMVIVIVVGLGYGAITLSVNDPLWFIPWFDETPTYVAVYCYGEKTELEVDSPEAVEIYTTLNDLLFGSKRWDPTSMSDETLDYYQNNHTMVVIELHYDPAVRIHAPFIYFQQVDTMFIPLAGRHSQLFPVFGRNNDQMVPGALLLPRAQPLKDVLRTNNLCTVNSN